MPADVLADTEQLTGFVEEPGRVQAAGDREGRLRLAESVGQLREQCGARRQARPDRRRADGDRLERALAAHSARGRGVEVATQTLGIERDNIELDGIRREIGR